MALISGINERHTRVDEIGTSGERWPQIAAAVDPSIQFMQDQSHQDKDLSALEILTGDARSERKRSGTPDNEKITLVDILYPESHPLDDTSRTFYASHLPGLLGRSILASRLDRLPPDDGRESLLCTREEFLAHSWAHLSSPTTVESAERSYMSMLARLETVGDDIRRGRAGGYHYDSDIFWIRDYDEEGSFVQWDCVQALKIRTRKPYSPNWADNFNRTSWKWPTQWSRPTSVETEMSAYPHKPRARWNRIIYVSGLARLVTSTGGAMSNPWFFTDNCPKQHLEEHRSHSTRAASYTEDFPSKRFNISFYAMLPSRSSVRSTWSNGNLYPCVDSSSVAEVQSITLQSTLTNRHESDGFWTIRIMFPAEVDGAIDNDLNSYLHRIFYQRRQLKSAFLTIVAVALKFAAISWDNVARYFDDLLNEAETLLSPNEHDMLLIEDSTFKRSRRYFWAIDALSNFTGRITEIVEAWEHYKREELLLLGAKDPSDEGKVIRDSLEKAELEIKSLVTTSQRLESHLRRTERLRDGLFNASAAMEARAATQLGENVKLLTYVSIFYLPLSFCTSLWSIGTTFKLSNLSIVMLLVAIATYLVVCNLDRLVQSGGDAYKTIKARVISRMKEEQKGPWETRAARFDRFEPQRKDDKPTEGYILLAALMFLFRDALAMMKRLMTSSSKDHPRPQKLWKRNRTQQRFEDDIPSLTPEDSRSTFKTLNEEGADDRAGQSLQNNLGNGPDQMSETHSSPPSTNPLPTIEKVTEDAIVPRPLSPQSALSPHGQRPDSKPSMNWLRKHLLRLRQGKHRRQVSGVEGVREDV